MPKCPRSRRYFRESKDEQGEHDCPFCGYTKEEAEQENKKIEEGEEE